MVMLDKKINQLCYSPRSKSLQDNYSGSTFGVSKGLLVSPTGGRGHKIWINSLDKMLIFVLVNLR